jgi:hypothetical protein
MKILVDTIDFQVMFALIVMAMYMTALGFIFLW